MSEHSGAMSGDQAALGGRSPQAPRPGKEMWVSVCSDGACVCPSFCSAYVPEQSSPQRQGAAWMGDEGVELADHQETRPSRSGLILPFAERGWLESLPSLGLLTQSARRQAGAKGSRPGRLRTGGREEGVRHVEPTINRPLSQKTAASSRLRLGTRRMRAEAPARREREALKGSAR